METDAERTLNNLHVLASVSQNDKLMTNNDSIDIYAPTTLRAVMRTWYGERRAQNIERVKHTVRNAITFAIKSLNDAKALLTPSSPSLSSNSSSLSSLSSQTVPEHLRVRVDTICKQHIRMTEALDKSKTGLQNLLQTYRDDATLSSQLKVIMNDIDDFLAVISTHTKNLKTLTQPTRPSPVGVQDSALQILPNTDPPHVPAFVLSATSTDGSPHHSTATVTPPLQAFSLLPHGYVPLGESAARTET